MSTSTDLPQPLGGDVDPAKTALIMGHSGDARSFAELRAETDRAVETLGREGLRFGDHIALLFQNEPSLFPFAWAAQRTGLYFTPVNWHLSESEAVYIVDDCDAKVLVASTSQGTLRDAIRVQLPELVTLAAETEDGGVIHDDSGDLEQRWNGFAMFYSSGTTGHPKGIVREPIREPAGTPGRIHRIMQELYGLDGTSTLLVTGPLYHAAPLDWSLATQSFGGTVVAMERFDAEQTLQLIERHRVTHLQLVPTMMSRLLKLPEVVRRSYDLSSLQAVIHAAAPCPIEVKRGMLGWLGPIVWEYYAGSEANGYFAIDPHDWLRNPGSVGRARLGTPHILDDDGRELPIGEIGTIWFEGTGPFKYHKDPVRTAVAFNDRGWSTLGDVGSLDPDGYLYLSDRRVDLIICGGVNIYPQEVENMLLLHPGVRDVAVVGAPDEDLGQRVVAVVQLEADSDKAAIADTLIAYCQQNLSRFKCPREVILTEELPRLPSGKMLRRRVREQLGFVAR